jgi:hypothetical protein
MGKPNCIFPIWVNGYPIRLYNFPENCFQRRVHMPDVELIATDAPVIRIKQVKEKRIKDKTKRFDKRPKSQNLNPRRR